MAYFSIQTLHPHAGNLLFGALITALFAVEIKGHVLEGCSRKFTWTSPEFRGAGG